MELLKDPLPSSSGDHKFSEFNKRLPCSLLQEAVSSPDFRHNQRKSLLGAKAKDECRLRFRNRHDILQSIKHCTKQKDLRQAKRLHSDLKNFIAKDLCIGTSLLNMLAKCGDLQEAKDIFEELPQRNVVSWNALMTGCLQHGQGSEAIQYFRQMQKEGMSPNEVTFICVLKACGSIGLLEMGEEIHVEVKQKGLLETNILLGTTLVDMYAKCGDMRKAKKAFEELPQRNVVSWSALIAGYAKYAHDDAALVHFRKMQKEGVPPNGVTFISVLKACGRLKSLEMGRKIHKDVKDQGFFNDDILLGTTLVDMYANCGVLEKAWEVLEELPKRDVISWSAMITGYVQHGHVDRVLECFGHMQFEGILPNAVTFMCVLKACASIGSSKIGEKIHTEVNKQGLLEKDIALGNALVDMYAKCGLLEKAQDLFGKLPVRNIVSWNALIAGYAQHGYGQLAWRCFTQMEDGGVTPDAITFTCLLKSCESMGSSKLGEELHMEVRELGFLSKDIILGNKLVDMYAKQGKLETAQSVFGMLLGRNVTSWNTLIAGYTQHGHGDDALKCFYHMKGEGINPDIITFIGVLKACGSIGSLEMGENIHAEVEKRNLFGKDIMLVNGLMNMYAKCGAVEKANELFEALQERDVVSWNILIVGYAQMGELKRVFQLLEDMNIEGVVPDAISLLTVLTACSHVGLVEEAEQFFDLILHHYSPVLVLEHYSCMVDLYGRAGCFDKLKIVFDIVPSSEHLSLFSSLLGACCKWENVELGRWAFEKLTSMDRKYAAAYVCMRNIYMRDVSKDIILQ